MSAAVTLTFGIAAGAGPGALPQRVLEPVMDTEETRGYESELVKAEVARLSEALTEMAVRLWREGAGLGLGRRFRCRVDPRWVTASR
jgi:hypothetical protein